MREGGAFQQKKVNELAKNGVNHQVNKTLVPQNGKGNVKGNRTVTDALVRESDGNGGYTYSIKEYKLTSKATLSSGQKASKNHVNSGGKDFELRSDIPDWGLKKGDIINVSNYEVETKK